MNNCRLYLNVSGKFPNPSKHQLNNRLTYLTYDDRPVTIPYMLQESHLPYHALTIDMYSIKFVSIEVKSVTQSFRLGPQASISPCLGFK